MSQYSVPGRVILTRRACHPDFGRIVICGRRHGAFGQSAAVGHAKKGLDSVWQTHCGSVVKVEIQWCDCPPFLPPSGVGASRRRGQSPSVGATSRRVASFGARISITICSLFPLFCWSPVVSRPCFPQNIVSFSIFILYWLLFGCSDTFFSRSKTLGAVNLAPRFFPQAFVRSSSFPP